MKSKSYIPLAALLAAASFVYPVRSQTVPGTPASAAASGPALPAWAIGPFTRQANPEPVIKPNPDTTFENPINHEVVHWEKGQVYNPAAVVRNGKIVVLYRAQQGPGNTVSRLGYAESGDGFHFTRDPTPVYFPAEDDQKVLEWMKDENRGGCEDPRLAEAPDRSYRLTLSVQHGISIASSTDLKHWTKLGRAFAGTKFEQLREKSAGIVHEIRDGKLVAVRINGVYWMYFGESAVHVATSDDLTHWKPLEAPDGTILTVMRPRDGFFDSTLTEVGSQAVLTRDGIVVFYNGKNGREGTGDPTLQVLEYCGGEALFDAKDPTRLLARLDKPFIEPAYPWEKTGLYRAGTTFIEGLALLNNQWFLYFGCADSLVGVAVAPLKAD